MSVPRFARVFLTRDHFVEIEPDFPALAGLEHLIPRNVAAFISRGARHDAA